MATERKEKLLRKWNHQVCWARLDTRQLAERGRYWQSGHNEAETEDKTHNVTDLW